MNRTQFILTASQRFNEARDFWRNWRAEARDDYAFVSGDQWRQEDAAKLEAEDRVAVTFNYSEKMIDAVVGAEVSNRQETRYEPRGVEDSGLADLWNAAASWVRDECNAEDEESDAFRDSLICGMGWTYWHLDTGSDPDGMPVKERVDPLEMYSDPAASRPGLPERRYHFRLMWVPNTEVRDRWPNAIPAIEDDDANRAVIQHGNRYNEETHDDERDRHKDQTQLRFYECVEYEPFYRVANGDEIVELSPDDFSANRDKIEKANLRYIKQKRRVYYYAWFSGETLLEMDKSPCQEGFCYQVITCKRDRNRNTWYGLTRVMKDPQRWANKWLSQILHIINSNAKGGIMAEIGAFVDPQRAQEEWAQADSVTLMNEGAISGKKVMPKQQAPYPSGLDKLMSFALESLPMVTGINLEALGLANREQAGVLESQRKQAAYGLLSPMFNALRHYRKEDGRVLLYFITNYISDGRLVRVGGPENAQYLPLTKQANAPRYDIIVDQSPNAPDTKQKTWEALVEIIPAMLKAGVPIPPDVLDFTPLPTSLAMKWKQFIGQQQQMNQEMQQQMQQLQEENNQLKQDQQVKMQELQFEQQKAAVEIQMEQQQMAAKIQMEREAHEQKMALEMQKAQAQFELESFKQDREFELEGRRAQHEATIQQQKTDNEFRIKAFAEGMAEDGKPDTSERKVSIGIDTSSFAQLMQQFAQQQQQQTQLLTQTMASLAESLSKPRATRLITNESGLPVGSETTVQ